MIHKTHWEGKPTLETLTGNHRAKIIICIITQNPWEIGFELLQHTTKSFSERSFFWFYQEHGTENNLESSSGVEPQTFRFPLWCSTTESQRLCCELSYYEVHMWDASSKIGLLELKAFLKVNQSPLFSPHTFDWSFWYKTSLSMSVVFPESIWAEIPIFLIFDTSFCQKRRHCYVYAQCTRPCPINKLKVV